MNKKPNDNLFNNVKVNFIKSEHHQITHKHDNLGGF